MRKLALVALLLAIPSMVQAKTLEDLLVEKGVITAGEARGTASAGDAKVYWNDGTRLEFPDNGFTTKINTQIQTAYQFIDTDSSMRESGVGRADTSSFNVERARLILAGTALNQEFSYKLQTEFSENNQYVGGSNAEIKDAYVQWEPCEGMGYRMGQFKTGLSRQYNTSSQDLQIPVRSAASQKFSTGRQAGLRAFYSDLDENYSVYASIYNGESSREGGIAHGEDHSGADVHHSYDLGIRANILGRMNPFVEGDIDMTEDLAVNVGAVYSYSNPRTLSSDFGIDGGPMLDGKINRANADVNVKYNGFSFNSEFYWADYDYDFGEAVHPFGVYAQAGYFFMPQFEVAARYSFVDCDGSFGSECSLFDAPVAVDDVNEAALSLNYYFWKHNLKLQLAYIFADQDLYADDKAEYGTDDVKTNIWRLQFSAYL